VCHSRSHIIGGFISCLLVMIFSYFLATRDGLASFPLRLYLDQVLYVLFLLGDFNRG
jgi:hypothetical protein